MPNSMHDIEGIEPGMLGPLDPQAGPFEDLRGRLSELSAGLDDLRAGQRRAERVLDEISGTLRTFKSSPPLPLIPTMSCPAMTVQPMPRDTRPATQASPAWGEGPKPEPKSGGAVTRVSAVARSIPKQTVHTIRPSMFSSFSQRNRPTMFSMSDNADALCKLRLKSSREDADAVSNAPAQSYALVLASRVLHSHWFDVAILVAIIANTALLATQVQIMAASKLSDTPIVFDILQNILSAIFLIELLLRLFVLRHRFFFGPENRWNLFDMFLVGLTAVELAVELIMKEMNNGADSTRALRVFRLLKVVRLLRTVRVIRFFKELRVMVFSILTSLKPLLWAIVLLASVLLVVGLYICQSVTVYRIELGDDDPRVPKLEQYFGTLLRSMYYLLQCVTGGISWGLVSDPLLELSWWYAGIMSLFTCFTFLALLNIITGVFVDGAIRKAQKDKEAMIDEELEEEAAKMRALQEFFRELDVDNSGAIEFQEFEKYMENPRAKAAFRAMGLPISKAQHLYRLLDIDDSGSVNISEFVMGCMRMIGNANTLDVATLMYENKRMMAKWMHCFAAVEDNFETLFERFSVWPYAEPEPTDEAADGESDTAIRREDSRSFDI